MIDQNSAGDDNRDNSVKNNNTFTIEGIGIVSEHPVAMITLRDPVVFPYALSSIQLDSEEQIAALDTALKQNRQLALFYDYPEPQDINTTPFKTPPVQFNYLGKRFTAHGMLVRVIKEMRLPDDSRRIVVRGLKRIICSSVSRTTDGITLARYKTMIESEGDDATAENLGRKKSLLLMFQELSILQPGLPEELQMAVFNTSSPSRIADLMADALNFTYAEKLLMLTVPGVGNRLEMLAVFLNRELESLRLGIKIQNEVQEAMGENQREFFLREQLKSIKRELGELSSNADVVALTQKFMDTELPEAVSAVVQKELERLELIPQNAPEYHISYNYISWLLDIPWCVKTTDFLDCTEAAKILDADHYGLEEVKTRILEFLAVMQMREGDALNRAPILCLVGPPGVGKTSIGQSIARALDRKFIRVSLGGVRDEAEIRGHRRTYVGALPGRIVQNLKRAGSINPVFMLDEIDKLAHDFRGDPASALLEVLDPEQNHSFNDHFVELPLDLSKVFFIATANVLEDIPGPLRDRMEIINIPGYTSFEKREIAKRYLIKRQIKENGLEDKKIKFQTSAVDELIDGYTMEAGVRSLDRAIAQVCRKVAKKLLSGDYENDCVPALNRKSVNGLLGARRFVRDKSGITPVGCATGMAWTSVGGVILPVETLAVEGGKGELKLTGSLGKVMTESAQAAFTLLKTKKIGSGADPEFFNKHDFHIHVPDGATPKDGPSAGITISLALASLLSGKPLIKQLAMTGEITLQGRVTAIGGVREKLVGAIRAGITSILLPEENRKDFVELPLYIRQKLSVVFVKSLDEAMKYAFGEVKFPPPEEK